MVETQEARKNDNICLICGNCPRDAPEKEKNNQNEKVLTKNTTRLSLCMMHSYFYFTFFGWCANVSEVLTKN